MLLKGTADGGQEGQGGASEDSTSAPPPSPLPPASSRRPADVQGTEALQLHDTTVVVVGGGEGGGEALPLYGTTVYTLSKGGAAIMTETTSITVVTTTTTTTSTTTTSSASSSASSATAIDTHTADSAALRASSNAPAKVGRKRKAGVREEYVLGAGGARGDGGEDERQGGGSANLGMLASPKGVVRWGQRRVGGGARAGRGARGGDGMARSGGDQGVLDGGEEEEEEGAAGMEEMKLTSHPSRHYIIPPAIARPLVLSSQMLLVQAVAALWVCMHCAQPLAWGLPPLLLGTYVTSNNFWSCPTTKSAWRYLDYAMVTASILYGTLVTKLAAPSALHALWCRGWGAVGAVFVVNEAKFWLNKRKSRKDYSQAVWVHLVAVHLGGNALVACALAALAGSSPL